MEQFLYVFQPFSTWTWAQAFWFVVFNSIALEALSWLVMIVEKRKFIFPGGRLVYDRDFTSWFYITTNKLGTSVFNYHLFRYCWEAKTVHWNLEDISIFNTILSIPIFFLAYDLTYSMFHRLLHMRFIYGYVHKHHHKQRAPMYGNDDAINTHPIEFWLGAYNHLFAVWITPSKHIIAIVIFLILITVMSAFNHVRYEVIFGHSFLYDNREHDTHHKKLVCNYAAYTQFWDYLLGTYVPYSEPENDYLNYPKPPTPAMCEPKVCAIEYENAMKLQDAPKNCIVTGGSGLVGARLVSMLIQRGAERVVSLDVAPANEDVRTLHRDDIGDDVSKIEYIVGDITNLEKLTSLFKGFDCVFHVAALVGPYYPIPLYDKVNNIGAQNVVAACKANGIKKLVMTSSPSTHMDGNDIYDKREEELPQPGTFTQLQEYARTKALGEMYALNQNSEDLYVTCIGPHQVYGPGDRLMLPAFLETAVNGRLRILGNGRNLISFTHIDNVAHAHILASSVLTSHKAPNAGKYYVVTDGGAQYMWGALNQAVVCGGMQPLVQKFNFNTCFLYPVSYVCLAFTKLTGIQVKLNPFVVAMCSIHRYFNIDNLCRDVGYRPIRSFEEAWPATVKIALEKMGIKYTPYSTNFGKQIATDSQLPSVDDDGHGKMD